MKLFLVVNVDWFFLSHRLPIALEALRRGYSVTIVAIDTGCAEKIRSYGLKFIPLPTDRKGINLYREARSIRLLYKLYKKHSPDVVHHVAMKPVIYGSLVARRFRKIKFVNALSGLGYIFTNPEDGGLLRRAVIRIFKLAFDNKRLKFIFQNEDDKKLIQDLGVVKEEQCYIINGSGVDLDEYKYTPEPPADPVRVVFTGRLLKDKGVLELVEAARTLKRKYGEKVLIILAGDTDENRASLTKEEIQAWEKEGVISWIGFHTDVYSVLAASHIVVLPSYREGLPKSLIEACAVGRPIVTTDVPGCRDVVDDGENGFIVPARESTQLAAAIEKLVDDPALRERMGKKGREKAEKMYSIESVLEKTFSIYESA